MRVDPTREELFEEAMNWTDRPLPDERLDVLLHYFLGIQVHRSNNGFFLH